MAPIDTPDTTHLTTLLQSVQRQRKTGRVLVEHTGTWDEIYVSQGQITAIFPAHPRQPLIQRLLAAHILSIHQLRNLPPEMGQLLSQIAKEKPYSDKQVANELVRQGLIDAETFFSWHQKEMKQELHRLMRSTEGHVLFEEHGKDDRAIDEVSDHRQEKASRAQSIEQEETQKELPLVSPEPASMGIQQKLHTTAGIKPSAIALTALQTVAIPKVMRPVSSGRSASHPLDTHTVRIAVPSKPSPLFQWETLLILALLLVAGLAHGINMFHYPYFEDDEGTYLSQAWAVLHLGRLAYYTYWYDHAPAGWIQIAGWLALTGGFRTFGSAMNSGRVFMLVLQLGSTFVLYRIARIISKSWVIASIVVLLFALSPFGLYYHRRILLDNIMTFWMLCSIFFLMTEKLSLNKVWLSALCLAISILSKEVAVFIVPALAYFVWIRTEKSHRTVAFISWMLLVFVILSAYPLMAAIKGELFPSGTLLGGNAPHVSLLNSLSYQGSRQDGHGGGSSIFNIHGYFWHSFIVWAHDDPILVIGGTLSAIGSLFLLKKRPLIGIVGMITLSLWAFLARGGIIIDFYLLPLLPVLALSFGLMIGLIAQQVQRALASLLKMQGRLRSTIRPVCALALVIVLLAIIPPPIAGVGYGTSNVGDSHNPFVYWNSTQTNDQLAATQWVEKHIPKNDPIVIDMYMWPELYTNGYASAHYYWKVDEDPAIRDGVFHDNWKDIDYIVTTHEMTQDIN